MNPPSPSVPAAPAAAVHPISRRRWWIHPLLIGAYPVLIVLHRSIWPAVIAHGIFDATSLALLPWVAELLQELRNSIER